jgi:uncharacterized membrane protein YkvA (DUF1232 family)
MNISDNPPDIASSDPENAKPARDERVVMSGFWPKIRATLGKVPFTQDAVAAFYCATDRSTPAYVRAVLLGALAYFVMPIDLIPDFIAGLGFTDDAAVFMAAFSAVRKHLTPKHRSKAQLYLTGGEVGD